MISLLVWDFSGLVLVLVSAFSNLQAAVVMKGIVHLLSN